MKQIAKSLVLVGAMVSAGAASAFIDEVCPYVGAEYQQLWLKGRHFWHNRVAKSYPGASIFLGAKFSPCWGAEIGYSFTGRKRRTTGFDRTNFGTGLLFPATFFDPNLRVRTSTRFNSFYFDLNGYVPLDDCWELIGSVGISAMKPKVSAHFERSTFTTVTNPFFANNGNGFGSHHGKSKAVWRLGVGAQYGFTECVFIRGMIRWQGTSALRVNRRDDGFFNRTAFNTNTFFNGGHRNKPFRDAVSASLGLFLKF